MKDESEHIDLAEVDLRKGYDKAKEALYDKTIKELATECWKTADRNSKGAVELMLLRVAQRYVQKEEPFVSFVNNLVRSGCAVEIGLLHRQTNARVRREANREDTGYRIREAVQANTLMMFRLADVYLKDATKKEVYATAERFGKQGKTLLHQQRFLLSVGRSLKGSQTVGQALTEAALKKLWKVARDEKK